MFSPLAPKVLLVIQSSGPILTGDWYHAVRIVVVMPLFGVEELVVRIVWATWGIPSPRQLVESAPKRQGLNRRVSTEPSWDVVLRTKFVKTDDHKNGHPADHHEEIHDDISDCMRNPSILLNSLRLPLILVVDSL